MFHCIQTRIAHHQETFIENDVEQTVDAYNLIIIPSHYRKINAQFNVTWKILYYNVNNSLIKLLH